jgi:hypothetical protein
MKINQIVSEHKKGVRARGYTKKGPEPRKAATQAATTGIPTAFAGQVAKEDMGQQVYKVTKSDPNTGLTLSKPDGTQLILPPDKMNAIAANPNDPNKYLLNPDAIAQQSTSGQPTGPEIGREVEVNADQNPEQAFGEEMDDAGDVGGDATDAYIDSVVDHDFERAQGRLRELAGMPPAAGEVPAATPGQPAAAESQAATLDSAEGFKAAITKAATDGGGDATTITPLVDKLIVAAPDGTVDAEQTLTNMLAQAGEFLPQMVKLVEGMIGAFTTAMRTPEFATLDAATQQSVKEALGEMQAQLPVLQRKAQEMQSQIQAQRSAAPRPTTSVQEAKELEAMLRIAGLR